MDRTFWRAWWRAQKTHLILYGSFCLVFVCVFALYHLPAAAVLYPALLCAVIGGLFSLFSLKKAWEKHKLLREAAERPEIMASGLPAAGTWEEEDYRRILEALQKEEKRLRDRMDLKAAETVDYYTLWVHQIKTPIASMRLHLQSEDSELSRTLMEELRRIEQYVDMVLAYLRLDSDSTDYVLKEYELDGMVRQAVRKLAGQFIRRKLTLTLEPLTGRVTTDEKWMVFVIEQVLSNALKYTERGGIRIFQEKDATLCISDTGIGIAPEDLPRIFEKGYTGYNGRSDKRASGIGLYLCRRVCANLGHRIRVESVPEQGTTVRIDMEQVKVEAE